MLCHLTFLISRAQSSMFSISNKLLPFETTATQSECGQKFRQKLIVDLLSDPPVKHMGVIGQVSELIKQVH